MENHDKKNILKPELSKELSVSQNFKDDVTELIVSSIWEDSANVAKIIANEIKTKNNDEIILQDLTISDSESEESKLAKITTKINENFKKHPENPDNRKKTMHTEIPEKTNNKPKTTCRFILIKGKKKGTRCTMTPLKSSQFCFSHNPEKPKKTVEVSEKNIKPYCSNEEFTTLTKTVMTLQKTVRDLKLQLNEINNKLEVYVTSKNPSKSNSNDAVIKLKNLRKTQTYKLMKFQKREKVAIFKTTDENLIKVRLPNALLKKCGFKTQLKYDEKSAKFSWIE